MRKGFTLIEVLFGIFILTISAFGSFSLIQSTLVASSLNESRLTAYYLAQEGIELVRNIRDGNWLEMRTNQSIEWDTGLAIGNWEMDFDDTGLTAYADSYLYLDADGNFAYLGSPAPEDIVTKFRRKISISSLGPEIMEVTATVYWTERGREHNVAVSGELTNWR